ncbi:MAG: aldo/keto reductase [Deltaproteobacteria bacterium]|nr:aldo/keto reductase [Deltaproteobacteria bacterium]
MEYRNLGASGVKVSPLCLGAMTFGEADENSFMHNVSADEQTSFAIMNKALDSGINFIDTADVYGQNGLSERVIGKWFEKAGKRNDVVLATKFRFTMGDGPNRSGGARYRIVKCVEDSLRRMKTDRIDLYQIHMQDITCPEEETLRALDDLISAGKVLYIGCSNYAAYRLMDSLWLSEVNRWAKFVSLQAQYSLVVRDLEREHVPLCNKTGVGILPWSPLAGGFLTGKYRKDSDPPKGSRLEKWQERYQRFDNERNWRIIDAVAGVAEETDSNPASVSLAWLLNKPAVSSVIFGARTVAQLEDNLKAAELELSSDHMQKLDDASSFALGYPYDFMNNLQGAW